MEPKPIYATDTTVSAGDRLVFYAEDMLMCYAFVTRIYRKDGHVQIKWSSSRPSDWESLKRYGGFQKIGDGRWGRTVALDDIDWRESQYQPAVIDLTTSDEDED